MNDPRVVIYSRNTRLWNPAQGSYKYGVLCGENSR